MGSTLGARTVALALATLLVGVPAAAQDASSAPSPTTSSAGPASPRPTELPSPTLDDEGVVVSNEAIETLETRLVDLVADLADVATGETRAQQAAAEARDRLAAADQRVALAAIEAEDAQLELARAQGRLRTAEDRLAEARTARDEADDDLAATERGLQESRELLQGRLRSTWMHGGRLNTTAMVLGMEDFNDVARVQHLLGEVVEDDNQLVADYLRLQLQRTDRLAAARVEEQRVTEAADNAADSRTARSTAAAGATEAVEDARTTQQQRAGVLEDVRDQLRDLGEARLAAEDEIDQVTAELEAEVAQEVQRRREEAERLRREEAERKRQEAERQRRETERQRQEAEREREEERRRQEEERLVEAGTSPDEARAADLRAQHQRRIAQAVASGETPSDVALPARNCGSRSTWVWPTTGCITSSFGYRDHPILATRRLHAGVDVPAPSGTPILAVADGRVHRAGFSSGGHGNVVVIDHGEVATLYAHQLRVGVKAGQQVVAGQVIGWVGSTGLSSGAHLHLETHLDGPYGTPVDPAPWFR